MDNQTYEKKLDPIIDLPQFEQHVDSRKNAKNAIIKEEERIVNVLTQLKRDGKISESLFEELKPVGSQPPRLYGLAKVHKKDTPLRPIVSMPGSAYYKVAKKVADWLSFVPQCGINTSTEKVSRQLKDIELSDDETLISFDVTSLYTNVPVKESIKVCADLLFDKVSIQGIDKDTFITLAELACCNVVFSTHRGYMVQREGLAMGSPPAPHLANGWLSTFDSMIQGNACLYERYMDDVLSAVKKDSVDEQLELINSLHPCLQFTYELEIDGQLPFLDMLICNKNGKLSSLWYRKPTDTGLTLNFHALAPLKYKKSVISSYIHRIYRASSSWENVHIGITQALQTLENNQYPSNFVMPIVQKVVDKLVCPENDDCKSDITEEIIPEMDANACLYTCEDKDKFLFCVHYRGKPTEKLANSFRRLNAPCKVIMKTKKIKSVLPPLKPAVPKMLRSAVVYKIDCPGCDSGYVGFTSRHLQQRVREHIGKSGVVRKHIDECSPLFRGENLDKEINILAYSNSLVKLMTLEALFIKQFAPSLNTKDEFKSRTLTLKF